jgi:hypothetical protein
MKSQMYVAPQKAVSGAPETTCIQHQALFDSSALQSQSC